jgi:chorismate mutase
MYMSPVSGPDISSGGDPVIEPKRRGTEGDPQRSAFAAVLAKTTSKTETSTNRSSSPMQVAKEKQTKKMEETDQTREQRNFKELGLTGEEKELAKTLAEKLGKNANNYTQEEIEKMIKNLLKEVNENGTHPTQEEIEKMVDTLLGEIDKKDTHYTKKEIDSLIKTVGRGVDKMLEDEINKGLFQMQMREDRKQRVAMKKAIKGEDGG